jgi:hypothetical protein
MPGIALSKSEKRRSFPPKRWKRMTTLQHLEGLLHAVGGGHCGIVKLTQRSVPYFS